MSCVLVTGLGGFIGKRVAPLLLDRGYEVVGAGRAGRPTGLDKRAQWITLDLFDHKATRDQVSKVRPSHCLNLAWYVEHGKYWRSPENLSWMQASLNLLVAFADLGGQRFVGAGTCAEYDWSSGIMSETSTPRAAASPFGRIKNSLFESTMAYADIRGLSAAWGRIFFLYGPDEIETRLVPSVIISLLEGREAKTSHGEQLRDFSYVDDVAGGLAALLDSEVSGAVNIGSGQSIKVKTIVETIGHLIGRPELIKLGAIAPQPGEPALVMADVKRLREEVGYRSQITIEDGLTRTIASYRAAKGHP